MRTIERSVIVGVPQTAAFDYVANFEHVAEWDPGVVACRAVTEGPVRLGSTYELDLRYGRSSFPMRYVVTELTEPGLLVLRGEGPRSTAIDRIAFVRLDDASTRIDYRADIGLRGPFRLVEPFLGGLFARIASGAAEGLEQRFAELTGR